jgi:hypothetical protein
VEEVRNNSTVMPEEEAHGVRMITLLMDCAVAVSVGNLGNANRMLLELSQATSSCGNRLVAYFARAMAARLMSSWVGAALGRCPRRVQGLLQWRAVREARVPDMQQGRPGGFPWKASGPRRRPRRRTGWHAVVAIPPASAGGPARRPASAPRYGFRRVSGGAPRRGQPARRASEEAGRVV